MLAMARRNASILLEPSCDSASGPVAIPSDVMVNKALAATEIGADHRVWRLKAAMVAILLLWFAAFIYALLIGPQMSISAYTM